MKIWELIVALGGFTVVVAGIATYFGKKIFDSAFKAIDIYQAKKIELFKGEISRQNNFINQVKSDQSKEFHEFNKKRIEAIDFLWKEILKVKEIGQKMLFMDWFMTYDEIENAHKSSNPNTINHLAELNAMDINGFAPTKDLFYHRPYLSNSLWLNYEIYSRILARSIVLIRKDVKNENWWRNDKYMESILKANFNKEEIDFFNSRITGGLTAICQLLEQRILDEIRTITTGEHASENSLKQVKKLNELLKKEK